MQNYHESVWRVWDKLGESIHKSAKNFWSMLYFRVSSVGEQTKRYLDPLFTAYFNLKEIIQDNLDLLSNHSSAGYAIVAIVNFAAMFLKIAVAVECVYHFRPYFWMIVKLFFYLLFVSGIEITKISAALGAILMFIVVMVLRLTSRTFMGLTRTVVHAFFHLVSSLVSIALLALNGGILELCLFCGIIVTLMLLWRRKKVASPRETSSNDEQQKECIICMVNPRNRVLIPCGHLGVCMTCAIELQRTTRMCPVCRQHITHFHQVYES